MFKSGIVKLTFLSDVFMEMDTKTKLLQTKLFVVLDTPVSGINTTDTDYIEQPGLSLWSSIPYGNITPPKFLGM